MRTQAESPAQPKPRYAGMVVETASEFKVRTSIYTDSRIFDDEMRQIFDKTWVYVAHESEVANPGDFRTASIGTHPVIVTRTEDGRIRVLLNTCRHRGNVVCRVESGNTQFFRCPYHGWIYRNDGTLATITETTAYPEEFRVDIGGLLEAGRVAVYRGLIFASLNPNGESLEEHLGPAKDSVDLWADRSPAGTVRAHRPHKFLYHGNWKYQAENGADGYHGQYVHESAFSTEDYFGARPARPNPGRAVHGNGLTKGFRRGHGFLERPGNRGELPPDLHSAYMESLAQRHGQERAERIAVVRHVLIFPNVYLMDDNIRVIQPISVDLTAVDSHYVSLHGVPDEINTRRLKNLQWRLGTSGFIAPDDMEMFARCQTGMQASDDGWIYLSRGLQREESRPAGERVGQPTDETPQRAIYREWARLMGAVGGPAIGGA